MKLIGIFIGLVSGTITGSISTLFGGNFIKDIIIGAIVSGLIAAVFFKEEIIGTDPLFDNQTSQIIMSNSWVFWIGNFLAALITTAGERLDYFWGGFVSCGLSVIIAMAVTGIAAAITGKGKINA